MSDINAAERKVTSRLFHIFFAFWLFLTFYKFAATLHYSLMAPLGARLLPLWIVGVLVGAESFFQMVLDVPAGYLVDRFGRKRMLGVGCIAFLIAAVLLANFSLVNFVLSVGFSVIGWLFFAPGANAYVLSYAEHGSSGRFIALRDTFYSLGVVLASVILPFVLLYTPFVMGGILAALVLVAAVALIASPPDKPVNHVAHVLPAQRYHIRRTPLRDSLRALWRLNPASGMLCGYSFTGAIFYGAIWFVVPLVIALQPEEKLLGLGLGVFDFAVVALGVLIGSVVDKGDKRVLVFYGLLLFALMALLIGATLGPLFLLFGFLATTGDEVTGLSLWSWLHSLDKEHAHDGAVAGAISFAEDFGYAIGPVIAGFAYESVGPGWALAICALPLVVTWVIYVLYARPKALYPLSLAGIPRMPMRRRHKL